MKSKRPKTASANKRRLHGVVSSQTLMADITRLQREIFALRKTYQVPDVAQKLLDNARETLHAAKRNVEWEAVNDKSSESAAEKSTS